MESLLEDVKDGFPFSHIAGISESLERNIHEWFENEKNVRTLRALMSELTFIGKSRELGGKNNPFEGSRVVVTGTFDAFSREELTHLLTSLGARTDAEVGEDTDYLLYGAVPQSKKIGLAMKHGVTMISEAGFGKMLEDNA